MYIYIIYIHSVYIYIRIYNLYISYYIISHSMFPDKHPGA